MFHTIQSEILRPDMALYTDIVYANVFNDWRRYNIPLKLNLMRPYGRFRFEERLPLLIWAEGGAWKSSAPASRLPELAYYAYHGFAVANVQYRVSTQSIWPAQIQDLKAAIRYLKVHADELGIDPERIVVAGESAGAHVAALSALTGKTDLFRTKEWANVSDEVQGAICWYCPGDMTDLTRSQEGVVPVPPANLLLNDFASRCPDKMKELSPITYVTPDAPPFLFLHGDQDDVVPPECALRLHDKLTAHNVSSEFYMLEGATHASAHFSQESIQKMMLEFMNSKLNIQ